MAYYVVSLIAQCDVVIEADTRYQAIDEAEQSALRGSFEVTDYITEELTKKDLDNARRFCDIDLTE